MPQAVFIFERSRPFNYGAFAKHMVTSGNVMWRRAPGIHCDRPKFRKSVEVELGVDEETAKEVVETMIDLGMIYVDSDNDVTVNERLR